MKCQENKTKVYGRQNWRILTLTTCELDDNRDLVMQHRGVQACDAGVKDSDKFISCRSARKFTASVCSRNTYGTNRYTTNFLVLIFFFFNYLTFHFLSSLLPQSDPFSSPIQRSGQNLSNMIMMKRSTLMYPPACIPSESRCLVGYLWLLWHI